MTGGLVTLGETMGLVSQLEPGPLARTPTLRMGIGGSESNVAIGVSRLGGRATWMGRVGHDEIGDLVIRELRAERVRVLAERDPAPTGLMIKTKRNASHATVSYYRRDSAGSHLSPADVDESAVRAADVLHVTGITMALGPQPAAAVRAAIEIARAAGATVSLDVNYRARLWSEADAATALGELLPLTDIVFAGESEAALFSAATTPAAAARAISERGPRQVIVKSGSQGSVAHLDGVDHVQAALTVPLVDPVGAGDGFAAGYLADLMAGRTAEERLWTAASCGAFAVTANGDWEGLPTRTDLTAHLTADDVLR